MNGITRVYHKLHTPAPLWGWFRYGGRWQKVQVTAHIRVAGCSKNEIVLPSGETIEVPSELLHFGSKPRKHHD